MKGDSPKAIYLDEYRVPDYLIETVDLEFQLDEEVTTVTANIRFIKKKEVPLVLNGQELRLVSLKLNDRELAEDEYQIEEESLTIQQVPDQFELQVITELQPQSNTSLEGLYQSSGNFCTQCEAEGFRKITWFPDRPDVMAIYTVRIVADRELYPVLLSNGNLVDEGELDNNRHWVKWHDPHKKPSYLFALVAGRLKYIEDTYRAMNDKDICLRIYVEAGNIEKCDHAMRSLKKAMQWDEEKYGLIYDLDIYMIVAVNDFNMGAMENKGLNVFNSKYVLASPQTATDSDYDGIESVIAHEYFHNWTGNRVTCRDWFQLSLKEGLTVFRDQEFSSDMTSRAVKRIQDVRVLRSYQFAEDAGPMSHPVRPQSYVEINNFYTVTVYNKGAEVVRMYQSLFGEKGFRKGMDLYFCRHDGHAVTTDDFCAAMADANKFDLTRFKRWYSQAGTPEVKVTDEFNQQTGRYILRMKQSCHETADKSAKEPFFIPVVTALLDDSGQSITPVSNTGLNFDSSGNMILVLSEPMHEFVFTGLDRKPVPSLLRGFSSPVRLEYNYQDEELAFLMVHEADDFNRWEAGQNLILRSINRLISQKLCGEFGDMDPLLYTSIRGLLHNKTIDKGIVAEILTLPSENYMAELQHQEVNVEVIHLALEHLKTSLASELKDVMTECYQDNNHGGEYCFNSESVAGRNLKNTLLSYLMQLDDGEILVMCEKQYSEGNNMTDVIAALACLANVEGEYKQEVLDDFYRKWQSDPLVLDKWFSIQARSRARDTLKRVQTLLEHDAFSIRNPNRVRSLIGSFASGNPFYFHNNDGAGYRLVADQVLRLDEINPQVAARMLQSFSRWKRYDQTRRGLMQEHLNRILTHDGLSRDCYEIASKTLS